MNRTQPTTYLGLGPTTTRIAFTEARLQGGFMVYEKAPELGTEIIQGAADLVEEVKSQAHGELSGAPKTASNGWPSLGLLGML